MQRILVCDDDGRTVRALRVILRDACFRVEAVRQPTRPSTRRRSVRQVDKAWTSPDRNGTAAGDKLDAGRLAAAAS